MVSVFLTRCPHLGDVHLVRPVNVDAVQTVAGLVSLDGGGHVVVTVEHDGQRNNKVHSYHCHCVRDEGAANTV